MVAEIGLFALILALFVAAVQAAVPLMGAARGDTAWMRLGPSTAVAQFALVALGSAALVWVHVSSDFSVLNVALHSHTDKPLLYKITGVWASHEGSMLLWVLILALYGAAVAVCGRGLPPSLCARVLSVQGMIAFGFLLFILFTSNPFARLDPPPVNGNGLNPLLQDPGLAFHPPFLYLGYVGFSIVFSFAIAALIEGRVDATWARWVRPWTLLSWCTLTIGIALGSWWSYYTLGWGGWWAWDPVENASLMPWLAGTALLHSAIVVEKRETLKGWTVFLAILTFSLSLLGTFLVRSGVLTSVHAFANDPDRGRFILALLGVVIGGSLILFALRAGTLKAGRLFSPVSREGSLVFNNLFLSTAAGTVLLGTLAPLMADAMQLDKISVGAPYYNKVIPILLTPMLLLMPVGPLLSWKRGNIKQAVRHLGFAVSIAAVTVVGTLVAGGISAAFAAFGLGLAAWLLGGTLSEWCLRAGLFRDHPKEVLLRIRCMPRAGHGMSLAHIGAGIMMIGIVGSLNWQSETLRVLRPGQTVAIAGYAVRLVGVDAVRGPNYTANRGTLLAERQGHTVAVLQPERRLYDNPQEPKSTAAIHTNFINDLYAVLGEPDGNGGWIIHIFHNPLVPWIFLGAAVMVLGGLLSLTDPRSRMTGPTHTPATPVDQTAAASPTLRYAIPALVFLGLIAVFFWRIDQTADGTPSDRLPSALIGKPAPVFDLPPLYPDRLGFNTAALKGHITVVNFFASWCAPCRAEHPILIALAKRDIRLIGIAYRDKPEAARAFLKEIGNPFAAAVADRDGRTAIDFGVYGVPETYIIDRNGIVRYRLAGPLTRETVEHDILPLVEALP